MQRTILLVAAAQQAGAWHAPAAFAPTVRMPSPLMSLGQQQGAGVDTSMAEPKNNGALARVINRRSLLATGSALLMLPVAAQADVYSDLGISRSQLGLKEEPPPPPLDPKEAAKLAQEEKKAAAKKLADEKKAAADAAKLAKQAEADTLKAEKAAKVAAEKDAKAKAAAQKKELEELGLTPEQLGLAGKPPKPSKPLTESQKRDQKKKAAEKKKKREQKKKAAKKEKEAAQKELDVAKKAVDEAKKSFEYYQSELPKKEAEAAKKEAALQKALKKEKSI